MDRGRGPPHRAGSSRLGGADLARLRRHRGCSGRRVACKSESFPDATSAGTLGVGAGVTFECRSVAAGTAASTVNVVIKGRPRRLDLLYKPTPLFFVTFCTRDRGVITDLSGVHRALRQYSEKACERRVAVGRYVIMPDHVHLFVQGDDQFNLSSWIGGLKRALSVAVQSDRGRPMWQPGFFDHLLRSDESYDGKWQYVRENPVRAGLAPIADDWPHQGEVVVIDRA
jgi:putative transposase